MMNEVGAVSDPRQEDDVSEGSVCGAMGPRQWRRVCREQQEQEREYEQRIGQATAALLAVQRSEAALQEKLRAHAAARPAEIARHNAMADELRAAKDELIKKNNELTRIKGQLSWGRNEARINEIIQRLEGQLRCNNYSLREENKIVAEINALKRSKSVIGTFNAVEAEVLKLREKENKLRRESSMDHNKFKKDMAKNAELVADSKKNLKRMAELQKELEQLRSGLSDLREMFEKRRASYEQHMEEQRRVRPATPTQPAAATITPAVPPPRPKPRRAPPPQTQTHSQCEEELRLISTLIVYLRKFVPHYRESEESTKQQQQQQQQVTEPVALEGMRVLKKEDQEEMLFTGNGKKNKKEKKRNNIKRMSHHSEVLQQFARLGLNPPNTSAEAEQAMKQLVQKKYDLTLPGGASHLPRLQINSTTSTSPPAPAMASGGSGSLTDGDSIITTPDNMLLRQPDFERGRRISQDSGLVVEGEGGEKEGGDDEVTEAGENGAGQGDGGEKGEESPIASEENGSGSGDSANKGEVDHEVAEAGENEGAKDNGKKEMEMSQSGEKGNNEEVVINTAASQDAKDSGEKSEEKEIEMSQGGEKLNDKEVVEAEEKVIESGVNQDTKDSEKEVLENTETDAEVIEAEGGKDTNTFDTDKEEESQKTTASEVEQVEGEIETNPVDDETERLRTESTSTLQAEEESEVTHSRKESSSDESSNLDDCDADADASASSEDEVIEYKPSKANVPQPEERESETESTNEVVGTEEVPQQDEKENETEITNEVVGTEEATSQQEVSIPLASQACSTEGSEKNDECDSDVESKAESTPSICLSEDEFPAIGQDEGANVDEVMANNQPAPKLTWAKIVARSYMKMKVRSKPAHSAEVVSNTAVVVSNTAEVVSNAAEAVSNTAEVVSTKEVVSNTTEVVSNTEEVSSAEEAVSSMQEVVLNSPCDSSPDSDGASESLDRCESASVANEKAESVRSEPVEESACEETVASENGDNPEEQESKCDAEDEKIVVEDVQPTGACNLEASAPESDHSEPKPASQYKVFTVSFTGKFHMVCDEEVSLQEATQQVEHSLLRAFPSSETWGYNQYQIRLEPLDTSEEHEVCVKNFH